MGEPTYRIVDWDEHFEVNRTRELKHARWIAVPNKHDGDSFTDLIMRPNGTSHYGAWILIVQVASKCNPRGTLVRDQGIPHTAATLARKTRAQEASFTAAIPILVEIGWLEVINSTAAPHSSVTAVPPHETAETAHKGALQTEQTRQVLQTEQEPAATWKQEGQTDSVLSDLGEDSVKGKTTATAETNALEYLKNSGIMESLDREKNGAAIRQKILSYSLEDIRTCWKHVMMEDQRGALKKPPLALFQALLKSGFTGGDGSERPRQQEPPKRIQCPECLQRPTSEMKGCTLCHGAGYWFEYAGGERTYAQPLPEIATSLEDTGRERREKSATRLSDVLKEGLGLGATMLSPEGEKVTIRMFPQYAEEAVENTEPAEPTLILQSKESLERSKEQIKQVHDERIDTMKFKESLEPAEPLDSAGPAPAEGAGVASQQDLV